MVGGTYWIDGGKWLVAPIGWWHLLVGGTYWFDASNSKPGGLIEPMPVV